MRLVSRCGKGVRRRVSVLALVWLATWSSVAVGQEARRTELKPAGLPQKEVASAAVIVDEAELQRAIEGLSAPDYQAREQAQRQLIQAGAASLPHLARALETVDELDLECLWRLQQTLVRIALDSDNTAVASEVREILAMNRGASRATLAEAAAALGSQWRRLRSDRAVERLQELGASVMVSGAQADLAMGGVIVERFAVRRQARLQMIPGRIAIRAAAIPIQRRIAEPKPAEPDLRPMPVDENEQPAQEVVPEGGIAIAVEEPIDVEGLGDVEVVIEAAPAIPAELPLRNADVIEKIRAIERMRAVPAIPAEPGIEVEGFSGEAEVPGITANESGSEATESEGTLAGEAAYQPAEPWIWVSIDSPNDLERWLIERQEVAVDPNEPWWTDENGVTHFDPEGVIRRRAARRLTPEAATSALNLPVHGPAIAGDTEPAAETSLNGLQRSVVINEQWQGAIEELRLLTAVEGLLFLQINGLKLRASEIEVLASCGELQRLSINRCEIDFEAMVSWMARRPELMIEATGTARMGIYGTAAQNGDGCRVGEILAGSPAELAGLMPGDLIVDINGVKIPDFQHLALFVSTKNPGDKLELMILRRDGHREIVDVELAERE